MRKTTAKIGAKVKYRKTNEAQKNVFCVNLFFVTVVVREGTRRRQVSQTFFILMTKYQTSREHLYITDQK